MALPMGLATYGLISHVWRWRVMVGRGKKRARQAAPYKRVAAGVVDL